MQECAFGLVAAALAAAAPLTVATADPVPRTVTIAAGDDMRFSVKEIAARRGLAPHVLRAASSSPDMTAVIGQQSSAC